MVPFRNTELYIDSDFKMIPEVTEIPTIFYFPEMIYLTYVIQK